MGGLLGDGRCGRRAFWWAGLCALVVLVAVCASSGAPAEASAKAAALSAGTQHTCATTSGGAVKCWGANYDGQLGSGSQTSSAQPVDAVGLGGGVASVVAGYEHTCAVTLSGGAKCWGYNYHGQVGNGSPSFWITTPATPLGLGSSVAAMAGGYGHSCALTTGGGVKCWGYNNNGQLGDGTTTNRSTPVSVSGLSGVVAISAGAFHTCALLLSGGARCWGLNTAGQLGEGTNTGPDLCSAGSACAKTPVAVLELSDAVTITAGGFHTCAITASGGAKCWGENTWGQLGDGTETLRTAPADVSGLASGVEAISGGGLHTCAIVSGGAKCWGKNDYGQLGDGTMANSSTVIDVSGLTSGVAAIGAGYLHACAVIDGGAVRCWGRNEYGQLGDGTTAANSLPVDVLGMSGAAALDSDGDSCADKTEIMTAQGSEAFGGRRSPISFWDFFDTPDESGARNGLIDLFGDIFGVAGRFGANDDSGLAPVNRNSDPLSFPPASPDYHPAFDRSPAPPGGDAWDLGAPDGVIDLFTDIFGVAYQFGHACT